MFYMNIRLSFFLMEAHKLGEGQRGSVAELQPKRGQFTFQWWLVWL